MGNAKFRKNADHPDHEGRTIQLKSKLKQMNYSRC